MPPPKKSAPRAEDPDERTNPGGPSPEVLAAARDEIDLTEALTEASEPVTPGPGEATLVYDKNKRPAGFEAPRLLVVAGPRTGSEYTLTEDETTIGRGSDNVVVIPDISVSRRHVMIARDADRWVLIDQRSGNGTRVNGRGVDRHPLDNGDEFAMGDTVVRFVEAGGVVVKAKGVKARPPLAVPIDHSPRTEPSERRGKNDETAARAPMSRPGADVTSGGSKTPKKKQGGKQRMPLYIAAAGVLIVLFGLAWQGKSKTEQRKRAAQAAQHDGLAVAQDRFQEGVALIKDGRWVEARDKLKAASEIAPNDQDIARYLDKAETEAPRAQAVATARADLTKRDYAGAKTALQDVPDDSALADAAHQITAELKSAMDGSVRDARNKMEEGDAQAANALVAPVLAADPGRTDALAISDAISGHKRTVANAQRAQAYERKKAADAVVKPPPPGVSAIVEAYVAGDIGAAMERAEGQTDPRATKLLHDLKAFDAAYRDGLARTQQKQLNEAIRALDTADKLDRAIAGGRESRLGKEVRRALGNLHYNLGAQALQSGSEEALSSAAMHLRYAVAADPENDAAKRQLSEVTSKVKELYQQAYFEKDSDPEQAKKAFKTVVLALPASDELQQKAKRWLDKLEGKVE
jgi:pSer/pThr/pTyr-binding forkhead associated (FHA) protein